MALVPPERSPDEFAVEQVSKNCTEQGAASKFRGQLFVQDIVATLPKALLEPLYAAVGAGGAAKRGIATGRHAECRAKSGSNGPTSPQGQRTASLLVLFAPAPSLPLGGGLPGTGLENVSSELAGSGGVETSVNNPKWRNSRDRCLLYDARERPCGSHQEVAMTEVESTTSSLRNPIEVVNSSPII